MWRIWKSQNEIVFNQKIITEEDIHQRATEDVKEWTFTDNQDTIIHNRCNRINRRNGDHHHESWSNVTITHHTAKAINTRVWDGSLGTEWCLSGSWNEIHRTPNCRGGRMYNTFMDYAINLIFGL